jgi:hypothetical protein
MVYRGWCRDGINVGVWGKFFSFSLSLPAPTQSLNQPICYKRWVGDSGPQFISSKADCELKILFIYLHISIDFINVLIW